MTARVGLTGGIGSGKSTAANLFAGHGIEVIDADQVARAVTAPGTPALDSITRKFGSEVLGPDGSLDRKALGGRVFSDASARRWLEQLLHPLIRECMDRRAADCDDPFCILEIPLLVESGRHHDMDCVVVVHCAREVRIRRLGASRGMTRAESERIMAQQATDEDRLAAADYIINNDGDLSALRRQVDEVYAELRRRYGT